MGKLGMEDARLLAARQHVAALRGLYVHVTVFVVVMALLLTINATTASPWWVQWPLLGWGLGLGFHALAVLGQVPKFARDWEDRQIKAYLGRPAPGSSDIVKSPEAR